MSRIFPIYLPFLCIYISYLSSDIALRFIRERLQNQLYCSLSGRLLNSPVYLSVAGLSLDQAASDSEVFIYRWLDWLTSADKVNARQLGDIYTRDDKLRQFAFKGNCASADMIVGARAGEVINSLGTACTGPLAEAVGGGS